MPSELALCRIQVNTSRSVSKESEAAVAAEALEPKQPSTISTPLIGTSDSIPHATLLQWIESISNMFFKRQEMTDHSCIRDWDLILNLDGSVENIANNKAASSELERVYPVRYRLPSVIWNRLSTNQERIQRAELFALGSILYAVISGKQLFGDIGQDKEDEEEIHSLITKGEFPEDLWSLPMALRVLACWCPAFAKEMLATRGKGMSFQICTATSHPRPSL